MYIRFRAVLLAILLYNGINVCLISQDNIPVPTTGFSLAFIMGGNFSQLDGDGFSGYKALGLRSGIQISKQLRPHSGISIGLLYDEKGGKESFGFSKNEEHIKLHFLSIPIAYYLSTDYNSISKQDKIRFELGVSISRLFNIKTNVNQYANIKSLFKKFDIAPGLGITYLLTNKSAMHLRFERSITNILTKQPADGLDRLSSFLFSFQYQYTL